MPCNKLAVQAAKLGMTEGMIRTVFASPLALQAIADALHQVTGEQVSVWNDQRETCWHHGYQAWSRGHAEHQTIPVDQIASATTGYMDFGFPGGCLRVYADGTVEARDGWNLRKVRQDAKQIMQAFNLSMTQIAIYLAQSLIAETAKQAGTIVSDQCMAGARIITLNL